MAIRNYLTVQEAANRLGVSRSRTYVLIAEGRIEAVRLDGKTLLVAAAGLRRLKRLPRGRPRKKPARKGKP